MHYYVIIMATIENGGVIVQMSLMDDVYDEEDDDDVYVETPPPIRFFTEVEGVRTFDVEFEQGAKPEDWERLVDACLDSKTTELDWGAWNGEASICTSDKLVHFTIGKFGDGDGGSMTISFAKEACVDAFRKAAAATLAACSKKLIKN